MRQYDNVPVSNLYFTEKISRKKPRSMTIEVNVAGHRQSIRVVKERLRIFCNGERVLFSEFRKLDVFHRVYSNGLLGITLKKIVKFEGKFATALDTHLNGPIELVLDICGQEYYIKSNFAKLM
jgi:hypothetical protein